jgi:hypothetical protein
MSRHIHVHVHTRDNEAFEQKHPRDDDGKFGSGGDHTRKRVKVPMEGTHTEITWAHGKVDRIQRLTSGESMGLPGWHNIGGDRNARANTYLADSEEEAIKALRERHAKALVPAPAVAPAIKPLDHGELNIPGRTNNINAQLDRYKRDQAAQERTQAKAATLKRKDDKARAKERFGALWPHFKEKMGAKFGEAKLRDMLDSMVKWEPAKFHMLADKFVKEHGIAE